VVTYQKEISCIQEILRANPKGMTVTDISRKIKLNRNSVAKYLDIMRISGMVELVTFGPAKVFFPSRRIPIATLLENINDYLVILDKELKIVFITNTLLFLLNHQQGTLVGERLRYTPLQHLQSIPTFSTSIHQALEGKPVEDIKLLGENDDVTSLLSLIPITFEDGNHGVSILIKPVLPTEATRILHKHEDELKHFFLENSKEKD
jgi:hypothetical protein